jgi:ACS family hexuronate transporter-like MFS transporter
MTERHYPAWRWWVCGALFLATLLMYMDRQTLPQTATELKTKYDLGDRRYGLLEAFFSVAFAVGAILFGFLADRFGPRFLYPIVLFGWSLAGFLTPLMAYPSVTDFLETPDDPGSGPFRWLLACRTLLGLFESGHWPCALITARQILSSKDRTLGNGILQAGATVGAVLVITYTDQMKAFGWNWQVVFWSIGLLGLLWLPLWSTLIRRGDLTGPPPPAADGGGSRTPLSFVCMYISLAVTVASLSISWQFLRAWLPKYLVESQGFSYRFQSGVSIAFFLFADVGSVLSGMLVRSLSGRGVRIHSARMIGFTFFASLTALAAVVPFVGNAYVGVALLIVAGAGILGLHPFYYSLVQELPARHMGFLSGTLTALGWLMTAGVQMAIGAHIEATKSYDEGLILAGLAPCVALVALRVLWRPAVVSREAPPSEERRDSNA